MTRILLLGDTPRVHIRKKKLDASMYVPVDHLYNPRATDIVPELSEYTQVEGDGEFTDIRAILEEAEKKGLRVSWL